MKYKAYTQYKQSNIDWISEIPKSWQILPAFSVVKNTCIKTVDGAEDNVLSLSYGNIVKRNLDDNFGLLPESFNTYQIVSEGNIILRLTDLQNDKKSLRVGYVTQKGIITSAYLKLACSKRINPKYAYFLLHSYDLTKVFYGMGGGLRQSMKFDDLKRLPMIIPSYSEQLSIVRFLDAEVKKIDRLIDKQEQLIELLKEKRQAVISHSVTKGLNPDVKMKYSDIVWLGEVPEHWRVVQLRRCINHIEQGKSPECEARLANDNEWAVLKSGCVNGGVFKQDEHKALPPTIEPHTEYEVKAGDLLMSRASGSVELIGSVAFVESCRQKLLLSDKIFRINIEGDILPEYFSLVMKSDSIRNQIKLAINGAEGLANNITKESIKAFFITMPPISEQKNIVLSIKETMSTLDLIDDNLMKSLLLLKERRSALISAVVTGKIDVRNWQPDAKDVA
ncbi:restriction endonuclease subunit S [Serratia sp. TKO39]|uniref:restriction endonuclease subunit S n=1 Tax=Serratia sp. TKO39 TaxID=2052589 RepID=UPI0012FE1ACE|nr:restriction endonuclease subunit S [Serratia sp. TKO39]